jgi:hypothetical protein
MSTNFPSGIDTLTNPVATDPRDSPSHAGQHANANDAIEALETKVGADSSAVATSLDYIVKNTTSGHDHDGTDSKLIPVFRTVASDSGSAVANIAADTLTVAGGEAIDTSVSGDTLTVAAEDASLTNRGVVELATDAEVATGTDATRAITPANRLTNTNIDAAAAIAISKTALGTYTAPTTFTPTWTNSGTANSIGSGTITGRYWQIGKEVTLNITLTIAADTTTGNGEWIFGNFPVTGLTGGMISGSSHYNDATGSGLPGSVKSNSTTSCRVPITGGTAATTGRAGNGVPVAAIGDGDYLEIMVKYEAA